MDDNELQQLLVETTERLGVVGAQLSIYDGDRQRDFVAGYRDRELKLPTTPDSLFQIGSTGKLFNAALILSLVDAGKLDLDQPVCEYVLGFRLADTRAQLTITLRQLLSMTAGLDNGPYYDFGRGNDALGRYVEVMSGIPQVFSPGSAFGYSNASTIVAGHVAAHLMGQSWERLLMDRIWGPLSLKHSALFAEDLILHPVALGYRKGASGVETDRVPIWALPRSMGPDGALACCSAGDLVRFARMFLDRGKSVEGIQVLSESAIETMEQPQVRLPTRLFADEWCVGPFRRAWDNQTLWGHSGTNAGGSSLLLWCVEKKMAIATVVNVAEQGYPFADAICDVVLPQMFGIKKPATPTRNNITPVQIDLNPYVGRFEAFGMMQTLKIESGQLKLTSTVAVAPEVDVIECELIPLGEGRFLPTDKKVSNNRDWDIAFWGSDASGRATHLLQGIFPLRRTS